MTKGTRAGLEVRMTGSGNVVLCGVWGCLETIRQSVHPHSRVLNVRPTSRRPCCCPPRCEQAEVVAAIADRSRRRGGVSAAEAEAQLAVLIAEAPEYVRLDRRPAERDAGADADAGLGPVGGVEEIIRIDRRADLHRTRHGLNALAQHAAAEAAGDAADARAALAALNTTPI
eukprot:364152-Chlamydomonas_euryale.AAC.12